MKEKKIKNICKIERIITALIIFNGFYQIGKNKNSGIWMVIIGIILIIILPKITKKVLNNKELDTEIKEYNEIKVNQEDGKLVDNDLIEVNQKNEALVEKDSLEVNVEIEEVVTNDSVKNNEEEIIYKLPNKELLENDDEINEIIESEKYINATSDIVFGLKDGENIKLIDLNETSHILIAGTTGMGKTNLLDNIIINLLYKSNPKYTKLLMIDVKNNSLRLYDGIPHLLIPVITDSQKAIGGLAWIVQEIQNRYQIFISNHVKNFDKFNEKMRTENKEGMAKIIVIIDDLYEVIGNNKFDLDLSITKITNLGKTAGIILVCAITRPTSNIISGNAKANIYTRISFFLPAKIDSNLILDTDGAEKLKNPGDLLFKTIGTTIPKKYHCPYISEGCIKSIVESIRVENKKTYNIITRESDIEECIDEKDPLIEEVTKEVIRNQIASTSFIQRKFKVGYERASRIMDQLEELGIVSGFQGIKPRDVLISKEKLEELNKNMKWNKEN